MIKFALPFFGVIAALAVANPSSEPATNRAVDSARAARSRCAAVSVPLRARMPLKGMRGETHFPVDLPSADGTLFAPAFPGSRSITPPAIAKGHGAFLPWENGYNPLQYELVGLRVYRTKAPVATVRRRLNTAMTSCGFWVSNVPDLDNWQAANGAQRVVVYPARVGGRTLIFYTAVQLDEPVRPKASYIAGRILSMRVTARTKHRGILSAPIKPGPLSRAVKDAVNAPRFVDGGYSGCFINDDGMLPFHNRRTLEVTVQTTKGSWALVERLACDVNFLGYGDYLTEIGCSPSDRPSTCALIRHTAQAALHAECARHRCIAGSWANRDPLALRNIHRLLFSWSHGPAIIRIGKA